MTDPKPDSQCGRILALLRDGEPHSMREIHRVCGFSRLNSRVSELRKVYGYVIDCVKGRDPVYRLVGRSLSTETVGTALVSLPGAVPAGLCVGAEPASSAESTFEQLSLVAA
jgi:hypothetical protein